MRKFHANKHCRSRSLPWVWALLLAPVIVALVAVAIGYGLYQQNLQPLSNTLEEVVIVIPEGTTASAVGETLENKGVIRSAWFFDIYTHLSGTRNQFQAGGYKLSPSLSVQEIVEKITSGSVATDLVTILPAQRIDQVKKAFIESGFSANEVNAAFEPSVYKDHPVASFWPDDILSLEGYLYPESFQKAPSTSPESIIRASLDETYEMLSMSLRSDLADQGLSVHEAIILASIVEREVSSEEDRDKVAQVFLKRLDENISLGSDPTALYGAVIAGIEPSVSADTPYNTRLYPGLPPGPINNVSLQSLQSVANPADTDFLFFVSGDDGNTYFSNTLAEHERLTAEKCVELCRSY